MPVPTNPAFESVRTVGGIEELRHRNGLTVLLVPDAAAPVVAFQVTYRVGSRNEVSGLTGATHLLEHLMFKGSERFNRDLGTSVFQTLQSVGGQINATTWYDRTNYYALLPAEHLGLAVEIEADRMRGARVRDEDLASERTVVLNELDRGENEPLRTLLHAVYATAFHAHPYGHPVIGWRSDVETVTAAGLRGFYDAAYWPRNATATVAGAYDRAEALDLIDQHFGAIASGPESDGGAVPIEASVTREPEQRGERRVVLKQAGELGAVLVAQKAPAGLDADADALDVLVQALAAGKSGRLYRRLTDAGLTTSAFAFFPRLRDPGLFVLYAALAPGVTHATVEAELIAVLDEVARDGLTDAELARGRQQVVADEAFGRDGPYAVVAQLNEAIALGDWTLYAEYRDRIDAVTPEAVQAAAARLVSADRRTVGHYIPEAADGSRAQGAGSGERGVAICSVPTRRLVRPRPHSQPMSADLPLTARHSLLTPTLPLATRTVEADAGPARLLVLPTATRDVVSFRASFLTAPDLGTSDDVALGLVADVLDKGTTSRDRHAFADALDGRGATLSFYSDSLRIGVAGRALRADLPDVLALAAEALREPLLDADEIRKAADRTVAAIRRSRESTGQQAGGTMARRLVPPDHPNYIYTPEDEEARTSAITPDDVRDAWRRHVGSDGFLLAVVGDADPGAVAATVADRFGGWAAHGRAARFAPDAAPTTPGRVDIPIADRTSLDVRLAHAVALRRDSPDFLAAYAAVYALGGNFSSRLMQTIRDEQGLTYGIGAALGGVAVEHDGGFGVSVTLSQESLERGIVAVREEVERFVAEGVPAEALAGVQTTLAGLHVVAMATTGGLAARLLVNAERGFDVGYLDRYPDLVRAITPAEATAALRRHVRPMDLHVTAAGTFPSP